MDTDKKHTEKARELHKNAMNYIEQILEATTHETTCTVTYLPSLKPSGLDKQDMRNIAGEARRN